MNILVFLLMSHKFLRFSLFLFILFSFCSCALMISNDLSSSLLNLLPDKI